MKENIKKWLPVLVPAGIALAVVAFFVFLFVVRYLWAWVIPSLFPGAVQQGLIIGTLDWWGAFKLAVFVCVLSIFGGSHKSCGGKSSDESWSTWCDSDTPAKTIKKPAKKTIKKK